MKTTYGLIGYPLSHSFSPAFFKRKFEEEGIDATYQSFPIASIHELPALLDMHPELRGLNVTIPYKEKIIPFLDGIDPMADIIGAVNCIAIDGGKTMGYNTDYIGFERSLKLWLRGKRPCAIVLGTGGAARAVTHVLYRLGISYCQVSRQVRADCIRYSDISPDLLADTQLIINTTPLGMFPEIDATPRLPYAAIGQEHLLFDLIYNPLETKFLSIGRAQGAAVKNGLEMLQLQALAGWEIWQRR